MDRAEGGGGTRARARSFPVPVFERSRVRSDNNKDDENRGRLIYSRRNVKPAFNCPLTAGTKCRFHGRPRVETRLTTSLARDVRVIYLRPRFSSSSRHSFFYGMDISRRRSPSARRPSFVPRSVDRPIKPADFNARGRRTSGRCPEVDACAGRRGRRRGTRGFGSARIPRGRPRARGPRSALSSG